MRPSLLRRHPLPILLALFGLLLLARLLAEVIPSSSSRRPPAGEGDGAGSAEILPSAPVPAGSRGTWRVRFIAGAPGIRIGGGLVVQIPPYWGWTEPQTESPRAPGFVTASASRPGARLALSASRLSYVLVTVLGEGLEPGDTVVVVYGDTGDGERIEAAAQADLYAERAQEFVVKVDGDGDGVFAEIARSPALEITPRDPTRLVLYGKATARPGEPFRVTVAFLDPFDNRATGARGVATIESDDPRAIVPGPIAFAPEDSGARAVEVTLFAEGARTLRAREAQTGLRAESPPVFVTRDDAERRLLWGDLHGHSGLSDGTGDPRDYFRYARDVTNLDVVSLTDHDHHGLRPLSPASWDLLVREANAAYAPGGLVTLLGYEWTNWTSGHRNVYFAGERGVLLSVADTLTDTPTELWAALDRLETPAMTIAHHPAGGPVATDWSIPPSPERERLVEIASVHGSSEAPGCPMEVRSARPGSFVSDALGRGYRLGVLASGDGHTGHPGKPYGTSLGGLAGIYATARTREAVWEALVAHRTYGTTGARILLEFSADGVPMGGVVPLRAPGARVLFRARCVATSAVETIELVRDGAVLARRAGTGAADSLLHEDVGPKRPGSWTYARVTQVDGEMAWSSPIWFVTPEEAAAGSRPPAP